MFFKNLKQSLIRFQNKNISFDKVNSEDPVVDQSIQDIKKYRGSISLHKLKKEIGKQIARERFSLSENGVVKVLATYVTSKTHYGPLVAEWAESLLDTALIANRKLIFIARDGIAPFKAAEILKKKYPGKYGSIGISLIHLSRTLAYSAAMMDEKISSSDTVVKEYLKKIKDRDPYLLRKYILQETGLQKGDRCIFVDVGFSGSLITPITEQLAELEIDIKFSFLISHTTPRKVKQRKHEAKGFLAHREKRPLAVVDKAGGNPAVHWIEDTHQSVSCSAKVLINNGLGRVVPAIVESDLQAYEIFGEDPNKWKTCRNSPEEYLIKSYGLKGVLDAVENHSVGGYPVEAWREASEERREAFGKFLSDIFEQRRLLLLKH